MPIFKGANPNRQKALSILKSHVKNQNLYSHCLAVEASMRTLAYHFNADPDQWGLAGLLHDADWEETKDDPVLHTRKTVEWMKAVKLGNEAVVNTILSHNHAHNGEAAPANIMEWSLYICDDLTGLIAATALVMPGKKLDAVKPADVLKKFGSRSFAAAVNREHIKLCTTKLQIRLDQFIGLVLKAMQEIAVELGL